jgi:hypothetical protein
MDALLLLVSRFLSQNTLIFDGVSEIHDDRTSINDLVNSVLDCRTFPDDSKEIYISISVVYLNRKG